MKEYFIRYSLRKISLRLLVRGNQPNYLTMLETSEVFTRPSTYQYLCLASISQLSFSFKAYHSNYLCEKKHPQNCSRTNRKRKRIERVNKTSIKRRNMSQMLINLMVHILNQEIWIKQAFKILIITQLKTKVVFMNLKLMESIIKLLTK